MRVNLQAQGVWDGTQREGVKEQQDRMALAAIYQAILEDVLLMLADKDTAKEAWETLHTMYMGAERVKEAKVQTLRSNFEVIHMKESESMDEFAMRLNTIVTGIRSLGDTIKEITVVKKFLRVVPIRDSEIMEINKGNNCYCSLTPSGLRDPREPIRGTRRMLQEEEEVLVAEVGNEVEVEVMAMIPKQIGRCFACEEFGHYASECPKKKHSEEANLTQTIDEEPTLMMAISYENAYGEVLLNEEKIRVNPLQTSEPRVVSDLWYIDNGASNHMTGDRSKFHDLDEGVVEMVQP
ncbi:ribonuclease H-like domain, reverse transcriptase, RNA-dependent DNA polymerase [Tanacetum coccineum]